MTAQVRLHCLGSPAVYLPDGSVLRFRVRKHLALLVFLAMEPRTHRRDRLAELLWPGGGRALSNYAALRSDGGFD